MGYPEPMAQPQEAKGRICSAFASKKDEPLPLEDPLVHMARRPYSPIYEDYGGKHHMTDSVLTLLAVHDAIMYCCHLCHNHLMSDFNEAVCSIVILEEMQHMDLASASLPSNIIAHQDCKLHFAIYCNKRHASSDS